MEIRDVPIEQLKMAEYNPRKDLQPGDPEYEKLNRSIKSFGYVEPIVWNERTGNVVGGHQRLKVLAATGATKIPVSVVNLPDAEEKALNIALNKIDGQWDHEKLADVLEELQVDESVDELLTGFGADEIDNMLGNISDSALDGFFDDAEPSSETQDETRPQFTVICKPASEDDQAELIEYLGDAGIPYETP